MNIWKDPQYSSTKVVLIIAIIAVGGYFAYKFAGNNFSLAGSAYKGTLVNPKHPKNQTVTVGTENGVWFVDCELTGDGGTPDWSMGGDISDSYDWQSAMNNAIQECKDQGGKPTINYSSLDQIIEAKNHPQN